MGETSPDPAPEPQPILPRRDGLSIAALTLGVVGLVVAVACWAAWLLIIQRADSPGSGFGGLLLLVLAVAALWFMVLPVSILAIIYGRLGHRRTKAAGSDGEDLAVTGIVTGIIALLVALAGAAIFAVSINQPPVIPLPQPITGAVQSTPTGPT